MTSNLIDLAAYRKPPPPDLTEPEIAALGRELLDLFFATPERRRRELVQRARKFAGVAK